MMTEKAGEGFRGFFGDIKTGLIGVHLVVPGEADEFVNLLSYMLVAPRTKDSGSLEIAGKVFSNTIEDKMSSVEWDEDDKAWNTNSLVPFTYFVLKADFSYPKEDKELPRNKDEAKYSLCIEIEAMEPDGLKNHLEHLNEVYKRVDQCGDDLRGKERILQIIEGKIEELPKALIHCRTSLSLEKFWYDQRVCCEKVSKLNLLEYADGRLVVLLKDVERNEMLEVEWPTWERLVEVEEVPADLEEMIRITWARMKHRHRQSKV